MMKRTVVVTAVGGDIGQSVIKCLRENGEGYDFHLIGCDMDPYAAGRAVVDEFLVSPSAKDTPGYGRFMVSLLDEKKVDYAIFISEPEIQFFDDNRDAFTSVAAKALVQDRSVIGTCMDKYKTVSFLKQNNLPYPRTFLTQEYAGQLRFPLALKRRAGFGGRGFVQIYDQVELDAYMTLCGGDAVLQEYLPGEEYTLGLFSDGTKVHSIAFKRQLGYGSLTKRAELILDPELQSLAEKIAKACGLRGSINVQLRKTERGYVPFEINPRLSSTVYIRHYFGFKDVIWWIGLAEARHVRFDLKYDKGVVVRNISEIFFDLRDNKETR